MRDRKIKVVTNVTFTQFGIETSQVRQPSLVDDFYYRESVDDIHGGKLYECGHPLYMLFNQERLDRLGPAAVQQWLKTLESSGNNATNQILKKVSDDDLLAMVKSRHIQHPCELERYLNDLNERADLFNSEVAKIVAQQKADLNSNTTESLQNNTDNPQ